MRIRSRRIDLAKDLRPGMKHRFTFYRDILIKSLRESSVDSIVRRDAIDCSHRGFKIKTELTEERRSVASYLCSLGLLLLNDLHDLHVLHGRWGYGFNDLTLSAPFIEILVMSLASRFIFIRSTIRI